METLTKEQAVRTLWKRGVLSWLYKPSQQLFQVAWEKSKAISRKFVLRATRRGRKSSWLLLTDFEDCIQTQDFAVAFIAPVETQLEEYIQQISDNLLKTCPEDLRPIWYSTSHQFYFPKTNSMIYCAGSNKKSYNTIRGKRLNRADVDEAAFVDDLDELIEGVLMPGLLDSNGYLRLSSSAPEVADHPFDRYCAEAKLGGYFLELTIDEAGYPPELIKIWEKEYKGRETARFQREYLCRTVIDPELKLTPEWNDKYKQEVKRDDFFKFYHKYDALDTGVRDFTVNLLGYYEFLKARLVVEDEILLRGAEVRTDTLASEIKRKEAELEYSKIHLRVADNNNLIIINDLNGIYKLTYIPTTKDRVREMVGKVRMWINSGRIIVNPRCKYLLGCLENGVWEKGKDEFARSKAYGHYDAIAALCYWVHHTDQNTNPIPSNYGFDIQKHHIPPGQEKSKNYQTLEKVLKVPAKKGTMDDWRQRRVA